MKYYAVRVGRTPGIYSTWESCAAEVKGYRGAVYKSFKTRKEAQMFLDNVVKEPNSSNKKKFSSRLNLPYRVDIILEAESEWREMDYFTFLWVSGAERTKHRTQGIT